MVRMPSVDSFSVIHLSSSAKKKRFVCRFGKNRRLVLMFEWDTLFPVTGTFPVIWHILDMSKILDGEGRKRIWNNKIDFSLFPCKGHKFINCNDEQKAQDDSERHQLAFL